MTLAVRQTNISGATAAGELNFTEVESMKIKVYNENGVTRIVEVTNRGTEITIFGSVIDGEFASFEVQDGAVRDGNIEKICK